MKCLIRGGNRLVGDVSIQGSKNAILPMIAAALLPENGQTVIENVPEINDVHVSIKIAQSVGAKLSYDPDERILVIDSSSLNASVLDKSLTSLSRASILFLAPLVHRMKRVEFNGVGGCGLGFRGLDFHHNGFKRLGAKVDGVHDQICIEADHLQGNVVYLDTPSQTSTENLMMGACLADGVTTIENAAAEPEVVDFAQFLMQMGAKIVGAGTRTIKVEGVRSLRATQYAVMPDRLDAGPFMMAALMTRGDVRIQGASYDHMIILIEKLRQMGAAIDWDGSYARVRGSVDMAPINIVSCPYPGFSTDFLPGIMAASCIARGKSYFRETVFQDRFSQSDGLVQMGAKVLQKDSRHVIVVGVERLVGASVRAPDLRAGMAYVLAGLVAEGETFVDNFYQVERGHSHLQYRLQALGAELELFRGPVMEKTPFSRDG